MKRNCMSMEYWHYRRNDTPDLASGNIGKAPEFNKFRCAKWYFHHEGVIFASGPRTFSKPLSTRIVDGCCVCDLVSGSQPFKDMSPVVGR
jgi:hypothetical protein